MTLEELEVAVGLIAGRLTTVENSTPTLEEQLFSLVIPSWNGFITVGSPCRMTLAVAPWPMRVLSVGLSFDYTTLGSGEPVVPASNTNYWRGVLERGKSDGSFPDMTAKTTQPSGGEANGAIYPRRSWTFDSGNWNSNRDLGKGDLLCLSWQEFGAPTPLKLPMAVTVGYAAL